jgi:ring-1,2-phenylacetyl-CoA epoxidase subunit PaaD
VVVIRAESEGSGFSGDCSEHLQADMDTEIAAIWRLLDRVKDPEIPVLSLADLGVLRSVEKIGNTVRISITPTYSGCPAMETMREDIKTILAESGYPENEVLTVLSPAWTTDWMSAEGKIKLEEFGIAPPAHTQDPESAICCPRCKSENTQLLSEFGSTACKAMYQCQQCKDTFCYFKVI